MAESDNKPKRDEIYSQTVRAGKRTYFFDVKSTRAGEYYLTITESKRRFNNEQGKFYYEKHKLFLYKEDFDKFADGFKDTIEFIDNNQEAEVNKESTPETSEVKPEESKSLTDVDFEDLGNETGEAEKDQGEEGEEDEDDSKPV
ncbi:MAG: DUF3276 family protein [Bacteroidota bacterium]|nr:DUF3276 family protein [Bacteroidota bacterium]